MTKFVKVEENNKLRDENSSLSHLVIRPNPGWAPLNLWTIWEYRELLYFLIWRDLKVRYKQTVLGVAWAVMQPVLIMIVFSIFFGRLAKIPSEGYPYPIFVFCALLPWQLVAHAVTESSNSLVANEKLITKVYFPRLIIPLAVVLTGLMDFVLAFFVFLCMMFYYGVVPSSTLWALVFYIPVALTTALGVALWLSAANVQFRDVRHTIPFMIQAWFFITPITYPSSLVPQPWRFLYGLNPMVGVVEGFRWALLPKVEAPGPMLLVSVAVVALLLISGLYYFRRMERSFADMV